MTHRGTFFKGRRRTITTRATTAAVADMVSEEWGLTLFTCDLSGESRVTVRCLQV